MFNRQTFTKQLIVNNLIIEIKFKMRKRDSHWPDNANITDKIGLLCM